VPPAQHAFVMSSAGFGAVGAVTGAPPTALQFEAVAPLACNETPPTVAAFRTLLALTAYHCGANPWSEPANVVGLPPINDRVMPSFSSASSYALRM